MVYSYCFVPTKQYRSGCTTTDMFMHADIHTHTLFLSLTFTHLLTPSLPPSLPPFCFLFWASSPRDRGSYLLPSTLQAASYPTKQAALAGKLRIMATSKPLKKLRQPALLYICTRTGRP